MNYDEQKKLARQLFPFIEIDDADCFREIISKLTPHRSKVLEIIEGIEIPSEWACFWARQIGDHDVMRDRVTESEWAHLWAREIGDRDVMRERVTDPVWVEKWNKTFGVKLSDQAPQQLADEAQELDMGY